MMLGLRDYVNKNRFPGVVLGLSGGIDSALVGRRRRRCAGARTRALRDDAVALYRRRKASTTRPNARRMLGVPYETIHIEGMVAAFGETLAPAFAGKHPDTTEENIQSRIRGVIADGASPTSSARWC